MNLAMNKDDSMSSYEQNSLLFKERSAKALESMATALSDQVRKLEEIAENSTKQLKELEEKEKCRKEKEDAYQKNKMIFLIIGIVAIGIIRWLNGTSYSEFSVFLPLLIFISNNFFEWLEIKS